jgi:MFS superfamily sulfate permease-like transporter
LSVFALVLSLGLLAMAPLGPPGVAAGLRAGLTTAVVGGVLYAWWSRAVLPSAAPSSATALLVAGLILQLLKDPALANGAAIPAILALCGIAVSLAGALQMLAGLLGVARLASYVPRPVVAGFMNGVALQVVVLQWPMLIGSPLGAESGGLGAVQPMSLALGLATGLAVVVLAARWPRLPAALLMLVCGTALYGGLAGAWPGLALGQRIGPLPPVALLPPGAGALLTWNDGSLLSRHASAVGLTALLIAAVGALETGMNALAVDRDRGTRHDPRRELIAIGATNLVLGLVGGVPAVMNRVRAVSVAVAGGTTRWALMAGSLALGILAIAGRPLLAWLPLPVLAGILLAVAWSLVDGWSLQLLRRGLAGRLDQATRSSLFLVAVVMLTTLVAGLWAGVLLGAVLSLLIFVARMNRSLVRARYDAAVRPSRRVRTPVVEALLRPLRPRVRIVELEGALFFGSGERLLAEALALPAGTAALVLDATRISTVDESGLQLLQDLHASLATRRIALRIAGLRHAPGQDVQAETSPDLDRAIEAEEDRLLPADALRPPAMDPFETAFLAGLDAADRSALRHHLQPLRLSAGDRLFEEGDPADRLYLLLSGSVSVLSHPGADGRSQRYLSISPGMLLGETAMLDGGGRTAAAEADTEVELVTLDAAALEALQQERPALAATLYRRIAVHLSQRLRAASVAWRESAA